MSLLYSGQSLLVGATGTVLPVLGAVGLAFLARNGAASPSVVRRSAIRPEPEPPSSDAGGDSAPAAELRLLYSLLGPQAMEDRLRHLLEEVRAQWNSEMAVVFRFDGPTARILASHGLPAAAAGRIALDAAVPAELARSGLIRVNSGSPALHTPVRGLRVDERARWVDLTIYRIGAAKRPWGALIVSTAAHPDGLSSSRGESGLDAMWLRVLTLLGEEFSRSEQFASCDSERTMNRDLLELRQFADLKFSSPAVMLQEFLARMGTLFDFERVSLYLAEGADLPRSAVARVGKRLDRNTAAGWMAAEEPVLSQLRGRRGVVVFTEEELLRNAAPAAVPFSSAAAVPLLRGADDVGALILTTTAKKNLSSSDRKRIEAGADLLLDLLARTVDRLTIEEQARLDGLTRLANRRVFDTEFERLLESTARSTGEFSLLLLDLDRFKALNDRYGHQAGDAALRSVAHVLQRVLAQTREGDQPLAARYGGEELAVLLPATGPAGARRIADAIREAVERTRVRDQGQEISVTLSGGVASFPSHGRTLRCLLTAADAALYAAKRGGRNRIEIPATETAPTPASSQGMD